MKIKAAITISRTHGMTDCIGIRLHDKASGIEFFDGEMSLADFASAVTGRGHCVIEAEVRGLQYVGKRAVREGRRIEYTGPKSHDSKLMGNWLLENAAEDGWLVNSYLGSQGSVVRDGDKTFLNYSVIKYVDEPAPTSGDSRDA